MPDAIVDVGLFTTEQGGRRGPTPPRAFGCPLGFNGEYFDCRFDLSESGPLRPGETARVPVTFLFPALIVPWLRPGSELVLWEGKAIGRARVAEILEPHPEQRSARREQLRRHFRGEYDRTLAILFEEDPMGINFGDNADEYEPEVDTILPRLHRCRSAADVQQVVQEEFVRWFDETAGSDPARYRRIAARIWAGRGQMIPAPPAE